MSSFGGGSGAGAELTGGEGRDALHRCWVPRTASEGFPRPRLILLVLCLSGHLYPSGVCSRCLEASSTALAAPAPRDVGSPRLGAMLGTSRDASTRPTALRLLHLSLPSPAALRGGDEDGSGSRCLRGLLSVSFANRRWHFPAGVGWVENPSKFICLPRQESSSVRCRGGGG